jgi:hypothetical protein
MDFPMCVAVRPPARSMQQSGRRHGLGWLQLQLSPGADRRAGRSRRRRAGVRKPEKAPHRDFSQRARTPCPARYSRPVARHTRTAREARQRPRREALAVVADDRLAGGACGDAGRRTGRCAGLAQRSAARFRGGRRDSDQPRGCPHRRGGAARKRRIVYPSSARSAFEAFGEPAVNRGEHLIRVLAFASGLSQPCEAG